MKSRLAAAALAAIVLACSPAPEDAGAKDATAKAHAAPPAAPAPIPHELIGREWRLTHFDRAEAVPEPIIITLKFEEDKISGNAGCNNYFAAVTDGDLPGEIRVGAAGATRMACPEEVMNAESRFLGALAHVLRYEMAGERLALTYREDNRHHILLLTPVDSGS